MLAGRRPEVARAGGARARPRARVRSGSSRRQAGEPSPRSGRERARLRLRDRLGHRGRRADGTRHRAGDGGLSRAGAGTRRARDSCERPVCARGRGVRAAHGAQALRRRHTDDGGFRPSQRGRAERHRTRPDASGERRRGLRACPREGSGVAPGDGTRPRGGPSRSARRFATCGGSHAADRRSR